MIHFKTQLIVSSLILFSIHDGVSEPTKDEKIKTCETQINKLCNENNNATECFRYLFYNTSYKDVKENYSKYYFAYLAKFSETCGKAKTIDNYCKDVYKDQAILNCIETLKLFWNTNWSINIKGLVKSEQERHFEYAIYHINKETIKNRKVLKKYEEEYLVTKDKHNAIRYEKKIKIIEECLVKENQIIAEYETNMKQAKVETKMKKNNEEYLDNGNQIIEEYLDNGNQIIAEFETKMKQYDEECETRIQNQGKDTDLRYFEETRNRSKKRCIEQQNNVMKNMEGLVKENQIIAEYETKMKQYDEEFETKIKKNNEEFAIALEEAKKIRETKMRGDDEYIEGYLELLIGNTKLKEGTLFGSQWCENHINSYIFYF